MLLLKQPRALLRAMMISLLCLFFCTSFLHAQSSPSTAHRLVFQGQLADDQRVPYVGLHDVQFSFYASPSSSRVLWTETYSGSNQLGFVNGHFVVNLGSLTPLTQSLFDSYPLFLGIRIDSELELPQRVPFHAQPYSFHAFKADDTQLFDGRPITDFLLADQAVSSINIQSLSVATATITGSLTANNAQIGSRIIAPRFVGDGSLISSLNASAISSGVLGLAQGGTGTSNIQGIRRLLGVDLATITTNRMVVQGLLKTNQLEVLSSGSYRTLGRLAFKNELETGDISDSAIQQIQREMGLGGYLSRTGGTMTGPLVLNNVGFSVTTTDNGDVFTVDRRGSVSATDGFFTGTLTTSRLDFQEDGRIRRLGDLAFQSRITTADIDNIPSFLRGLGMGRLATQNRVEARDIDLPALSSALNLGALAFVDRVQMSQIDTANFQTALGLGSMAYKNQVAPSDINLSELATAMGLGRLAYLSEVQPDHISVPALSVALGLGTVATHNQLSPDLIDLPSLRRALGLQALAYVASANPTHIQLPALTASLNLQRLAFLSTVPTDAINMADLSRALGLGRLATQNQVSARDFVDINAFKRDDLGLGDLAFKDRIVATDFQDLAAFRRDTLRLGDLASKNAITASDVANVAEFRRGLGLGSLATADTVATGSIQNYSTFLTELTSALRLGRLAFVDRITASHLADINAFKRAIGYNDFVKRSGDQVTGNLSFNNASLLFNDGSGTSMSLAPDGVITARGVTANTVEVRNQLTVSSLAIPGNLNVRRIRPAEGNLVIENDNTGITLNRNGEIAMGSKRGAAWSASFHNEIDLRNTKGNLGLKNNAIFLSNAGGTMNMSLGNKATSTFDNHLYIGHDGVASIEMNTQSATNPSVFMGFNRTGPRLQFERGTVKIGAPSNGDLEILANGTVMMKNRNGLFGLLPNGQVTYNATTRSSLQTALDILPSTGGRLRNPMTIQGDILLQDRGTTQLRLANNGDITAGVITVNTLSVNTVNVTGEGTLGDLAYVTTIQPSHFDNFSAFAQQHMGIAQLLRRNGGVVTQNFTINNANLIMKDAAGNTHATLSARGDLSVQNLNVPDGAGGYVNIFNRFAPSTIQTTTANVRNVVANQASFDGGNISFAQNGVVTVSGNLVIGGGVGREGAGLSGSQRGSIVLKKGDHQFSLEHTANASKLRYYNARTDRYGGELQLNNSSNELTLSAPTTVSLEHPSSGTSLDLTASGVAFSGNQLSLLNASNHGIVIDRGAVRITAPDLFISGNINMQMFNISANALIGNGSAITQLNASNFGSGILPVSKGGTGVTSVEAFQRAFALDLENPTLDLVTVRNELRTPVIRGIGSNQVTFNTGVDFTQPVTFNRRLTFSQPVNFAGRVTYTGTVDLNSTMNFQNDVIVQSAGTSDLPSLHVVNTINKHESRHALDSSASGINGNTAIMAESFGVRPTIASYHYYPQGAAFMAYKGPNNVDIQSTLWAMNDGAMKIINMYDDHALVAYNNSKSDKATIKAVNTGTGHAIEAISHGELPAITARSLGNTAIFAMGDVKTSSSKRWKRNIQPIENPISLLRQLRGVSYTRTDKADKKKRHIGFIAEEVGKVIPEVVDYEANGKDAKSVAYGKLTAVLVEALKAEHERVQTLERTITDLETENKNLQKRYEILLEEVKQIKIRNN